LNQNHIDLDSPKSPRLFVRYSASGSRYKERNIELSADWVEAYHEYLAQYHPVDQVFPWSRAVLNTSWRISAMLPAWKTPFVRYVPLDKCAR